MGYNTKKEISERASVDMTYDISGEFKIDGEEIKSVNNSGISDINDIIDINNKSDQNLLMNSL